VNPGRPGGMPPGEALRWSNELAVRDRRGLAEQGLRIGGATLAVPAGQGKPGKP